ncbi:hypothetical protein THAOC_32941 [Thalassiosira oceanica]|uniref:Transmembrane protein n=1 Tax=Thalassiosira oceanica TaxID=159749 RepID=K0R858_THAOC|nr:hypothetical protein THAOC_32941 [Thalassiosira oceanica]|eukprot:EJK48279.1 hypothetical protein THAOC_32941 [Thalassiosira oceanica]
MSSAIARQAEGLQGSAHRQASGEELATRVARFSSDKTRKECGGPSPFSLKIDERLSPRSSAWGYLAACSLGALSCFVVTSNAIIEAEEGDDSTGKKSVDKLLLSMLSVSSLLASAVCVCFRHRGLRHFLTRRANRIHASVEYFLALLLFAVWCVVLRYVSDPQTSGLAFGLSMLTINGKEVVWNAQLWISSWLGYGIASYIVGSLILASPEFQHGTVSTDIRGQMHLNSSDCLENTAANGNGDTNARTEECVYVRLHSFGERTIVYWFMVFSFSSAVAAYSLSINSGDECRGTLNGTPFCKRATLGHRSD